MYTAGGAGNRTLAGARTRTGLHHGDSITADITGAL
jgi:hypothetical protein